MLITCVFDNTQYNLRNMPWTEGIKEIGSVNLNGKDFPVSRVITHQKRFIEVPNRGFLEGEVWELVKEKGEENNHAYVLLEGKWISGCTFQKRWSSGDGRPERQNVFVSDDNVLSFVVTSERITV